MPSILDARHESIEWDPRAPSVRCRSSSRRETILEVPVESTRVLPHSRKCYLVRTGRNYGSYIFKKVRSGSTEARNVERLWWDTASSQTVDVLEGIMRARVTSPSRTSPSYCYIVMEEYQTDVHDWMNQCTFERPSIEHVPDKLRDIGHVFSRVARQCLALEHHLGLYYTDVKRENIVLKFDGDPQRATAGGLPSSVSICDFEGLYTNRESRFLYTYHRPPRTAIARNFTWSRAVYQQYLMYVFAVMILEWIFQLHVHELTTESAASDRSDVVITWQLLRSDVKRTMKTIFCPLLCDLVRDVLSGKFYTVQWYQFQSHLESMSTRRCNCSLVRDRTQHAMAPDSTTSEE